MIFISYRRDDLPGGARSVRDALAAGSARRRSSWTSTICSPASDEELAKAICDVFLAIISPRRMELLATKTASGERDYVREEIAAAL